MDPRNQRGITTFWGISIILMVVVVVVFVFYILYYFWIENPVPTSEILIIRAVKHQSISVPAQVDTAGWQSYTNSTYPLTFQYPATLTLNEDEIFYGTTAGHLISLRNAGAEQFSLRIFPVSAGETIEIALKRLTGIDPAIYQSFPEHIDGQNAVIYRQKPGTQQNDRIYIIHNGYLFEAPYNASTVNVLSTFKLL